MLTNRTAAKVKTVESMSGEDSSKSRSRLPGEPRNSQREVAEPHPPVSEERVRTGSASACGRGVEKPDSHAADSDPDAKRQFEQTVASGLADPETAVCGVKNLLRNVMVNTPVVVWAVNCDGEFILSEGKGLEGLGQKPGEVVGRSLYDVCRAVPEVGENTRRALAGETVAATVEAEGAIFDCWYSPLREQTGDVVGVVGMAIDVTERRRTEAECLSQRRLLKQMLQSHEREYRLIAYEVHDGPVQEATAAQMHLEALLQAGKVPAGEIRDEIALVLGLVRNAIGEARQLINGLRPPILDELGLVAAIEHLIEEQPEGGPSVRLTAQLQSDGFEPLLEGMIFRIVQEAITNVRRHSKSERAEIRLAQLNDWIRLEIRDWGVGFDPAAARAKHFGLQGIRERGRLLQGRVSIESWPGKGTRILVELPIVASPWDTTNTNDRSIE